MNSIQELTEEIYTKIANRVLKRKQKLKVMNFQIIDGYYNREKLLSSIMHNKRIPKRNPYLLNDKISKCIVRNLKFSSQYELVWGKDSEYDYLMREVFETGVTYLEQSTEYSDLVHNCLYTYLPFTKIFAKYENSLGPEKPDDSAVFNSLVSATAYVYYYVSDEIKKTHQEFFFDKGTKKLDNRLEKYFVEEIPKVLKKYVSDSHNNGLEIFNMFSSIIKYETDDLMESLVNGPEWYAHQPVTNTDRPWSEMREKVIDAGETYISTLIEEQSEMDSFFCDNLQAEIDLDEVSDSE